MSGKTRAAPAWSDVKGRIAAFDRAGLIGLLKDLHGVSRDNQAFLHARLGLGDAPLAPYKKIISRWINPDVVKGQDVSVAKAKKAISDYQKAIARPEGVAELCVFYCEEAASLLAACGIENEGYFTALVRMFERALTTTMKLPEPERSNLVDRLDSVRSALADVGWGVKDSVDDLWFDLVPRRGVQSTDRTVR